MMLIVILSVSCAERNLIEEPFGEYLIALLSKLEKIVLNDSLSVLKIIFSLIKFWISILFSTNNASIVDKILLISLWGENFSFLSTNPANSIFSNSNKSSIISESLSELSNIDLVNLAVIFGSWILPECNVSDPALITETGVLISCEISEIKFFLRSSNFRKEEISLITRIYSFVDSILEAESKKYLISSLSSIDNSISAEVTCFTFFNSLFMGCNFFAVILSPKKKTCFPNISKAMSLVKRTLKFLLKIITPWLMLSNTVPNSVRCSMAWLISLFKRWDICFTASDRVSNCLSPLFSRDLIDLPLIACLVFFKRLSKSLLRLFSTLRLKKLEETITIIKRIKNG